MQQADTKFIQPDWPAPAAVRAFTTTRAGGISLSPYSSFNLAQHVGDDSDHVAQNRSMLKQQLALPEEPQWLQQIHGTALLDLDQQVADSEADGSFATVTNKVCTVMTADCLPILMCSSAGDKVAALHAGWRGLAAGIIGKGVAAMAVESAQLLVWLGPAIGPQNFEVGAEVYQAFVGQTPGTGTAFESTREGHWRANLYQLARLQLSELGVQQVYGGEFCTFEDTDQFYSYRRDGVTGRMATLIWLQGATGD